MSFLPAFRRLCSVTSLVRCECVLLTNSRNTSHKELKSVEQVSNNQKDISKIKVYLKDEKDNILGIKSLAESKLLAQKHRMNLIEDKLDSQKHKYRVFKMISNQFLSKMDDKEMSDQTNKSLTKESKHLVFSTKLSENDLMTKIKHTKRWLSRGHHISIHVTNPKNDIKVVENIFNQFETELKSFAKLNQKKIKSDKSLKFVVVPNPDIKEHLKAVGYEDEESDDIDIDNMDPNKLLSDEFELKIDKKLDKKH